MPGSLPPLPAGFSLDQPEALPPLPAGFQFDSQQSAAPPPPQAAPTARQTRLQTVKDAQKYYSLENNIGGAIAEPVTTLVTGGAGMVAGGMAGIVQGIKNLVVPGGMSAADRVEQVQHALTYEPRTAAGKATTAAAGKVLGYPFRKLAEGADKAGQVVTDATGSPLAGAATNTAIQSLPAVLLRGKVTNGRSSPNRVGPPAQAPEAAPRPAAAPKAERPAGLAGVREKPPALEELRAQKDAAYKKAEDTGVVISRGALNRLKTELVNDLKQSGLTRHEKLHPKASAALEEILGTKGQLTLTQIEHLRRLGNDVKGVADKTDSRLGAKIVEKIDDFEENLGDGDVVSGSPAAASAYKEARALNTRLSKATEIEELVDRAKLSASGFSGSGLENALRTEFRSLSKNKNKMRRFNPEERAAIQRVATGGHKMSLANIMRYVGKLAPTGTISTTIGIAAASAGGVAIPIAGTAGRIAATQMTKRNAARAGEVMRRGPGNALVKPRKNSLAEAVP